MLRNKTWGIAAILVILLGIATFVTGQLDQVILDLWSKLSISSYDCTKTTNSSDTELVNVDNYFSEDYKQARTRFVRAAKKAGAIVNRIIIGQRGPDDEELTIEIAWFGNTSPHKAIIHTSGLHGVEGFAGSAIQLKILESKPLPPEDGAIVFVHILNPYGMAWLRRYNESNVDLNRNFRYTAEDWQIASETYNKISGFLNPVRKQIFDSFLLKAIGVIANHDYSTLKQAIAGGQNQFPKGLFYAGQKLEQQPSLYGNWLENNLSSVGYLFVIDVHTGLGSRCQELLAHKVAAKDSIFLSEKLEEHLQQEFVKDHAIHYEYGGGHSNLYGQVLPNTQIDFITQEFGTYSNLYVLQALREENRYHHFYGKQLGHPSKQRLKKAFCPAHPDWRTSIIENGVTFFEKVNGYVFSRK